MNIFISSLLTLSSLSYVYAQSASNYTPVRSTGITYSTILGSGTAVTSWRNGTSDADNRSNAITIGFDFWYIGTKYTTLSVSTNGFLDFSSSAATGSGNADFGYDEADFYGTSSTVLALAPLYSDLEVPTYNSNGSVAYSLTGSAPNRVFTVEWLTGIESGCADGTCNTYNYQVKLNESTGVIEYWYGSMTGNLDYVCGLNGATVSVTPTTAEYLDQTTANTATFGQGQTTLTTVPTSNTKIVFTPPTTTVPTTLTFSGVTGTAMTLNWTNAGSNRVVSAIYKSTDDVTYTYDGTASSGATTYAASGLSPSTTYYWKVYSVSEGYVSTALSNSQATTGATTVTWDGGAGTLVWTTATNWSGDVAPVATDIVVFNTAGTFTITSVPTISLSALTISDGTVTLSGSTTTLTLGYGGGTDLTIASSKGLTLSGVSITLSSSATADISGTLTVTTGTFNTDGTSVVSTVATTGSISCAGTVTCTSAAKLIFEGSSSYTHTRNGGTIPTADWNGASNTATSTCTVTGMTSTKPGGLVTTSNTFYHFTWNCAGQTANLTGASCMAASGENFTCNGNFTITNTNGYTIVFSDISGGTLSTLTVGGNMVLTSGGFFPNFWSTPVTVNITGNLNISGGAFYLHAYSSGATTILNITGSLNLSGGQYFTNEDTYTGTITLNVTTDVNVSGGDFVGSYTTGPSTHNITGNFNFSGGAFYGTYSSGVGTFNITGNLNISGGTFQGAWTGSPTYTIGGNLAVSGTGIFHAAASTGDPTFDITGTLSTAGSATFYASIGSSTGNPTFNIQGSVDLSTGTVGAIDAGPTSNSFVATFNLTGTASNNLTLKTGLTYNTSAAWKWSIASGRTITLLSNVELGGTASSCSFTNNGTLIMGTYTFPAVTTAAASFVNASGATLKTACLTGITALGTATGAILVTGTRTYNTGGSYVFNGAAAQITGTFATTVANLEMNNSSGLTLTQSIAVTNTLTLTAGLLKTVGNTLTIGTTSSNGTISGASSTCYIVAYDNSGTIGYLKHFVNSNATYSFPIGDATNYTPLTFVLSAGTLASAYLTLYTKATKVTGLNASITNYINRYWDLSQSGITSPTYDISYTYVDGDIVGSETGMLPIKKSGSTWYKPTGSSFTSGTAEGTGSLTAGSNLLSWTGLSTFSLFGGAVNGAVTLPVELTTFIGQKDGKNNILFWATASEMNNDFFTIEKTTDGENFEIVGTEDGAGNSNQYLEYSLTDYDVREVINYYRLKQTDFDGKYSFSEIISIDNRTKTSNKEVVMITNILGQEVNEFYRGVVIVVYADGTSIKIIQ